MRKIAMDKLPLLLAAMDGPRQLWLPVERDGRVDFELWQEGANVSLAGKTGKSCKDFFFPQTEDIVTFKTKGKEISIIEKARPDAPFVVFGMRGCDAAGMEVLDRVFLSDPKDTFYEARRRAGTIVSVACAAPDESCFCTAFGIDPAKPAGDVTVWIAGDTLYWKAVTEKGEALTAELSSLLEDAGEAGDKAVAAEQERITAEIRDMPFAGITPPKVTEADWFGSSNWAKLSKSCLGCGTCTFVCPTCQCYDIRDRDSGDGVRRFRCWDSCMYSDFTLMAHGNIRNTQLQRYRQRFMHKLVYFPANNDGMYSCVGCGRCVERCPSALNIVKVMRTMEANADE